MGQEQTAGSHSVHMSITALLCAADPLELYYALRRTLRSLSGIYFFGFAKSFAQASNSS